jgi:RluA family pseudouridine synthase
MREHESPFKKPSKKHQPKGLSVLYEDHDILVVDKADGLLTMGTEREKQKTAYFLLTDYVKKGNAQSRNRLFIVHRLDRDASGILVFAKNENAKRFLQDQWKAFTKKYLAVVHGKLQEEEGEISSYLFENKIHRVYSVNDPAKGKFSKTGYEVIKESDHYSLLEINLFTGRKNQIRVHLAEKGHPIVGDKVYGKADKGIKRLALHASSLTIRHPFTNKEMRFKTVIPPFFKTLVK